MQNFQSQSYRTLKVGEEIKRALGSLLIEESFFLEDGSPLPTPFITEVRTTSDLKHARIYFSTLHQDELELVNTFFQKRAPLVRKLLAKKISLRFIPSLTFVKDTVLDQGDHVDKLLKTPHVQQDL